MNQQTATMTQSITNTKLMIATGIMLIAGGLAFAATPLSNSFSSSCVKNMELNTPCKGGFQSAQIICKDGFVYNSAPSTRSCLSVSKWMSSANKVCKNHCKSTSSGTYATTTDGNINTTYSTESYATTSTGGITTSTSSNTTTTTSGGATTSTGSGTDTTSTDNGTSTTSIIGETTTSTSDSTTSTGHDY